MSRTKVRAGDGRFRWDCGLVEKVFVLVEALEETVEAVTCTAAAPTLLSTYTAEACLGRCLGVLTDNGKQGSHRGKTSWRHAACDYELVPGYETNHRNTAAHGQLSC